MSEFSTTLKSITRPYEDNVGYGVTLETPEELIAYCARVSSHDNQNNKSTADKLLKYCKELYRSDKIISECKMYLLNNNLEKCLLKKVFEYVKKKKDFFRNTFIN